MSFTINTNEADLALLEENLKTTNELTAEISKSLELIARKNSVSINAIQPLMGRINYLKMVQTNIASTSGFIENVKLSAKRAHEVESQLKSMAHLKDFATIQSYLSCLSKATNLSRELRGEESDADGKTNDLSQFKGIIGGLTKTIDDSERNLRMTFDSKVSEASKPFAPVQYIISNAPFPAIGADKLKEIVIMLRYFQKRNKNMMDTVTRTRKRYVMEIMKNVQYSTTNFVNTDPNYLYGKEPTGISGSNFEIFAKALCYLIKNENDLYNAMFRDNSSVDIKKLMNQTFNEPLDFFNKILLETLTFIESKKFNYGTMLFEIRSNVSEVRKYINLYIDNTKLPQGLELSIAQLEGSTRGVFNQFFEYMTNKYHSDTSPNSDGFNTTFLGVATRLRKYTLFRELQLLSIENCARGSWLPALSQRPAGFEEQKVDTQDPQFLLSCFYSDAIVMNFCFLENKFKTKLAEDDLGLMLLNNLDALQNVLDKSSELKLCLGQPGMVRYEALKRQATNKCLSQWQEMTKKLMESAMIKGVSGHSAMSAKEMGKLIDEFNKSFEDNFRKIQVQRLPEYFKSDLINDISKTLVPAYRTFYAIVTKDNSMKNAHKHFKYDPTSFSNKMRTISS